MRPQQAAVFQHGERQFSLSDAEHRVQTALAELGLTARLTCFGGDPTMWSCQLADDTGAPLPQGLGSGKGGTEGARIGSMYEALEHLLTQSPDRTIDQVVLRSCGEVAASALASEPYAGLLDEQPEASIACRIYRELGGHETLAVPVFLSTADWDADPLAPLRTQLGDTTDYTSLARYSSNSGSAIGGSFDEAAVHAVNEAIERDAMSMFLIRSILAGTPSSPAFLDPATLPDELQTLLTQVQDRIGREVWLIDVTTDLGVPSTLAYATGAAGDHLRGNGASLSHYYSIYRALTELLQIHLCGGKVAEQLKAIELLKDFPALQACAELDLRPLAASTARVPYRDTTAPPSPTEHLSELLAKLADRGFTAYLNETHRLSNGITAVHAHIPGLERFHMIVDGPCAVVPGRRGIAACAARGS